MVGASVAPHADLQIVASDGKILRRTFARLSDPQYNRQHYQSITKALPIIIVVSSPRTIALMVAPPLRLRFFGPGLILDSQGVAVAMRSRKQLALLAYLSIEHQVAHSRDHLMALLWPEEPPNNARNNLRVTLSRLRNLFNSSSARRTTDAELLLIERNTVQLNPAWVMSADVNRFHHLLERTSQHTHPARSQCSDCQPILIEAVQLHQAAFLEGFGLGDSPPFDEWLVVQQEHHHLLLSKAYSDLTIYAETNHEWTIARDYAQRQIELDPLREPAYRQLMRILAWQGERSLALSTFERCRALLNAELGLNPEPETLALHMQILNDVLMPSLAVSAAHSPTLWKGDVSNNVPVLRHNLTQPLTPFIGRDAELVQLQTQLADPANRLLSIVGPGGIGKTRLAQQAAIQCLPAFPDGVYFVALAQAPTTESIPTAIAEALGLAFAAGQKPPTDQLIEMIGSKKILLVLDNFEHLMAGVDFLMALLRRAPQVVLLVTSRERLNLQSEDLFELQGLPTPPTSADATASNFAAVRLFVDRAHRLDKRFTLTAERLPQVVRICQLVEGFPLALELAATWIRELTCAEIVAELTRGLSLLETSLRDVDPAHRSLRAVFNASWRLLTESEQRALASLTVFRGGFSSESAHTIANASPALLGSLRNKSLLRNAGSRRYDMHALIHQFSAEYLAADPAVAARVQQLHGQHFMTLLAEQALALDTREARAAADRIQPDWENVTQAWRWAATNDDCALLRAALEGLTRFCDLRGLFLEAQALLEHALVQLETAQASNATETQRLHWLCRLLTALAYFAERSSQYERTLELSQRALALAQQLGLQVESISNYIVQASAFRLASDFARSVQTAEMALQMAQAAGLEYHSGLCLDILGLSALRAGQFERAQELFHQVLAIHERTGRLEQQGRAAIGYLGRVATDLGRYDVALQYYQRFLAGCEAVGDRRNTALAQHYLARLWLILGEFEKAIALESKSVAGSTTIGDRELSSRSLHTKAAAHRHCGQFAEALANAHQSVTLARALDAPFTLALALGQLAETQMEAAKTELEWQETTDNFQEATTIFRSIGRLNLAYEVEIGLAESLCRRGDWAAALRLITPILPHLPTVAADGWDEPVRAYLVCTQVLRTARDARAETLLAQGLRLLDCLAQNIADAKLRQNFLNAVPANRQLRALYETKL